MSKEEAQLRTAEISDFPFFYLIKSEKKNMKWTGHSQKPDKEKLFNWFGENLQSSKRKILIYTVDKIPVGYAYVDDFEDYFETSVAVSEIYEGKGFGQNIVAETVKYIKSISLIKPIVAWILDKNQISVRIHVKAGYIKTNETRKIRFSNGITEKMTLYKLLP